MQLAAPTSREIQLIYPSLHDELRLSTRDKPADVDKHTASSVVLRIPATSFIGVLNPGLAAMLAYAYVRFQ